MAHRPCPVIVGGQLAARLAQRFVEIGLFDWDLELCVAAVGSLVCGRRHENKIRCYLAKTNKIGYYP
jgi:hypothetical protein